MTKRINLFKVRLHQDKNAKIFQLLKLGVTVAGIALFAVFSYINYRNIEINQNIRQLAAEKQNYLSYLMDNKNTEAQLRYFKSKQSQLLTYAKDDAHFLPYFKVLEEALKPASKSAALETVVIEKDRETSFDVSLADFNEVMAFLKYIESATFLDRFTNLVLSNVSLIQETNKDDKESVRNYKFTFKGSFKEIDAGIF